MKNGVKHKNDIFDYEKYQELTANKYVMRCFLVTMIIFTLAFFLNLIGVFIIEQGLMMKAYIPSCIIYLAVLVIAKLVMPQSPKLKYIILLSNILVFTIMGVFITYHVVLAVLLPFLYATLYSSKRVMWFVYALTVISTAIIVYGGFYFGLCDANMALLTAEKLQNYVVNGIFTLNAVNPNPQLTLFLFFVLPRCLVYIAFAVICNSINAVIMKSLQRARTNNELEVAKTAAENANKAKTQFLVKMSHEIRTPINVVLGMNEMILRESTDNQIKQYADDIKNSSNTLLNIVNDILDSSKIEAGMMEILPVKYELGSMINDLYNLMSVKAQERRLKFSLNIDPNVPKLLYGDDRRIKQVLMNLLSNAVKYTNRGEVSVNLSCKCKGETAFLHYCVKDTGIGIKKEDIEKIYDAYQRFDVQRNRNIEGTGLGMNIVQELLRLMDSEIKIESEPKKGSEFSFVIAQKIVDPTPIGEFNNRFAGASNKVYRSAYTAPEAKILVVDDYTMNLKVFKGLLKSTQIQIDTAESGKECLAKMETERYDIVFLDHMMPYMDGVETLKEIKRQKLCEGTPIVMLTANAIIGDREKFINKGFDDYLSKPIAAEKLDKMILRYLPEQLVILKGDEQAEPPKQSEQPPKPEPKPAAQAGGLDYTAGLATCGGDKEFYLELLGDFTELNLKNELEAYLAEGDFKNYCIRVHGFKNSAYSIGAKTLGDLAYEVEKATKQGFTEEIAGLQAQLFDMFDAVCESCKQPQNL